MAKSKPKIKKDEPIMLPEDSFDMFAKHGVTTIKKGSKTYKIGDSKKKV